MKHSKFKFIDLFAGIGGFHHAMHELGGECVMTCEFDPECQKTYRHSFKGAGKNYPLISNIREITRNDINDELSLKTAEEISEIVPDHDVLCGGFPCQPFSKSGEQLGIKDKTRGTLFFDIIQILEAKRPKFFFLENVRNLAGPRHVETWKTIIEALRNLDYVVSDEPLIFSPHLLAPELGGAPQVRERVFIFGVRKDFESDNLLNIATFNSYLRQNAYWNPNNWRISSILDNDDSIKNIEKFNISSDESVYLEAWDFFVQNITIDTLPGFPIWAFAFKASPEINDSMPNWKKSFLLKNSIFYNENKKFIDSFLKMKWGTNKVTILEFPYSRQILEWQARKHHSSRKGRTLQDLVIQFRPSGIRVKPPTYLPALVAITQTSVVGPKLRKGATTYRKLTPVEASRLQGIPDFVYKDDIVQDRFAYKQLGNAVNVGIVKSAAAVFMGLHFYEPKFFNDQMTIEIEDDEAEFESIDGE